MLLINKLLSNHHIITRASDMNELLAARGLN